LHINTTNEFERNRRQIDFIQSTKVSSDPFPDDTHLSKTLQA
jgi:hypothetical protein